MKGALVLIAGAIVACIPADAAQRRVLSSGRRIEVLGSGITGWPAEFRSFSVAYTSDAVAGAPLLQEIREVWEDVRAEAERSDAHLAFINAKARYPYVAVYMVGWDLPKASLVPREKGSVSFKRLPTGRWEEGPIGCSTMGWCELRGGFPPQPAVYKRIGPLQPEFVVVLLACAFGAWLAGAVLAGLLRRIRDCYRRWLYGGAVALLAGAVLLALPVFLLVGLFRLSRPDVLICEFAASVWLSFFVPVALYVVRLRVLVWRGTDWMAELSSGGRTNLA
jgi:hypothetical protein